MSCSGLQCVAVGCSVVQSGVLCCSMLLRQFASVLTEPHLCCGVLQRVAVCCSESQCAAMGCSVVQYGAVW